MTRQLEELHEAVLNLKGFIALVQEQYKLSIDEHRSKDVKYIKYFDEVFSKYADKVPDYISIILADIEIIKHALIACQIHTDIKQHQP